MKANGWKSMSLGAIALMSQYGLSYPASADGDVPMLRMNNLTTDGKLDTSDLVYVRLSNDEFEKYRLQKGDLLFNRTNSNELVGKTTLFELDEDFVFASYLIRFKLNPKLVDPRFVSYFFNTDESKDHLRKLASKGVSQSNINPTILKERFFVPVPPLQAQIKIAETLRCWDSAIEQIEKLVTANTRIKRGLMRQLLTGRKRFNEFVIDDGTHLTQFGTLPNDWEYLHIGDISREISIKNTNDKNLTVLSCTKHHGLVDSLRYFGKRVFSENTANYKVVKRGHFAYATNHIEEGSIGYQDLYDEALISPMYTVFETSERVDDSFFYKLLKTELYRHIFEVNTSGSIDRRGGLRWNDFARIKVALPSLPEQHRIAAVLNACDKEITLLKQQLDALKRQKRGLMQKLLTGQIRVKS
jgi:type I restriction enzyme S subunit